MASVPVLVLNACQASSFRTKVNLDSILIWIVVQMQSAAVERLLHSPGVTINYRVRVTVTVRATCLR